MSKFTPNTKIVNKIELYLVSIFNYFKTSNDKLVFGWNLQYKCFSTPKHFTLFEKWRSLSFLFTDSRYSFPLSRKLSSSGLSDRDDTEVIPWKLPAVARINFLRGSSELWGIFQQQCANVEDRAYDINDTAERRLKCMSYKNGIYKS